MAERTYKFETDDDTIFIANDNWQLDNVGCLQANVYYFTGPLKSTDIGAGSEGFELCW